MVRIKFTGPPGPNAPMQMQTAQGFKTLASKPPAAVQNKSQNDVGERAPAVRQTMLSKQQQSQEMVQIMVHVVFGTLFYLREFLPLSCFDDRDLKQTQKEHKFSYREFVDGKAHPAFKQGRPRQTLKVMVPNADPAADAILDVLEHGIFDAINRKVLEAIQLTILRDKNKPSNVLESYTFSFKYTGKPGHVDTRLESLSLDPVGCVADMGTIQSARKGLESIVRNIIELNAFLPMLPNKRHLGIHMFYTEDCPAEYEAPGFDMATSDVISYPYNEDWSKVSQSMGSMDSGCHTVGLKITSLSWTGPDPIGSEAAPQIPPDIEYRDTVPRTADIEIPNDSTKLKRYSRNGSFREATRDVTERQKLQKMIPTQEPSSFPDSDLIPTQPVHSNVMFREDEPALDPSQKVILSPNKVSEIRQYIRLYRPNLVNSVPMDRPVRCQCAWDGEDPAMIECTFCHSRQHALCYGLKDSADPKSPDIHACYQCLLGPSEPHLLGEMNTLVLLRRALEVIRTEGFQNKTSDFSQRLHCNGSTVVQIRELLKKQGFIQPTPGYKRQGFWKTGLPKYHIPPTEDTRRRMQREVFDPLAKIGHHYLIQHADGSTTKPRAAGEMLPSNSNSQGYAFPQSSIRTNEQGSHDSRVLSQLSRGRKRKQFLEPSNGEARIAMSTEDMSEEDDLPYQNTGRDAFASQQTPRSQRASSEEGIRRSGRKRRKISNYKSLINVGAAPSSDDSAA